MQNSSNAFNHHGRTTNFPPKKPIPKKKPSQSIDVASREGSNEKASQGVPKKITPRMLRASMIKTRLLLQAEMQSVRELLEVLDRRITQQLSREKNGDVEHVGTGERTSNEVLIDVNAVARMIGLSRSTVYKLLNDETSGMPKPVHPSKRSTRWHRDAILNWMQQR